MKIYAGFLIALLLIGILVISGCATAPLEQPFEGGEFEPSESSKEKKSEEQSILIESCVNFPDSECTSHSDCAEDELCDGVSCTCIKKFTPCETDADCIIPDACSYLSKKCGQDSFWYYPYAVNRCDYVEGFGNICSYCEYEKSNEPCT